MQDCETLLRTSHRLSRCHVVLTTRLFKVMSENEFSGVEFLSFVTIWILSFVTIWVIAFCHNLIFTLKNWGFIIIWVLELSFFSCQQKFEFLSYYILIFFSFIIIWVFELYQFDLWSFVKILFFLVLSQLEFQFGHHLSWV